MAKKKCYIGHRHRELKHLPYAMPTSKKATDWCAFDSCKEPDLVEKGSINNRVRKQIIEDISEME